MKWMAEIRNIFILKEGLSYETSDFALNNKRWLVRLLIKTARYYLAIKCLPLPENCVFRDS